MKTLRRTFVLLLLALLPVASHAQEAQEAQPEALFETVAKTLASQLYDHEFREGRLVELIEEYRPRAAAADSSDAERRVVNEFLSHLPYSHLGLLSQNTYAIMSAHLNNDAVPLIGFEIIEFEGGSFVHGLLQGSAADEAGVLMGDRIVTIDGIEPAKSPRLDWPSSDANGRTAIRQFIVEDGQTLAFHLERAPGEFVDVNVTARPTRAIDAARRPTMFERGGRRIGYMHLHYVHMARADRVIARNIDGPLHGCEAFIIDLRGRGGSAQMAHQILRILSIARHRRGLPIVAIIDQYTRSAKEMIAFELRRRDLAVLVGERTAGALLPASFMPVSEDFVLMFPAFRLPGYSDDVEGVGVEPHVNVEPLRMYTNGSDPLIERAIAEAKRLIVEKEKAEAEMQMDEIDG